MFQFENAQILYALFLIPIGIFILYLCMQWKFNVLDKVGDPKVIRRLFPDWSARREWLKGLLVLLAFVFLIFAWSNPQWGTRKQKVKTKSTDVVIALDISQSMMAEDVTPNRMERAKRFCNELIKKLRGDRIGLIFFAGSAYLQMPLSQDHASAELFIKSASPKQAGTQGTVIADAIKLAENLFIEDSPSQKAVIVISDGENHEMEAIEAGLEAIENGTSVFTVGIGTEEGAYVPFIEKGKKTYKRDKSGNPVSSALNVGLLQDIAEAGGGEFFMIDQAMTALNKLDSEIEKLQKREVEQRSFTDYNSYFQYFLFPAILLIIFEYLFSSKSSQTNSWKQLLGIKKLSK